MFAAWLIILSGQSVWSQSSLYFDRGSFMNACQTVPGNQQIIDFANYPFFGGIPTLTISDVTFTGRSLASKGITSGIALYNFDGSFPLSIHFANGARAFGGDFSSYLSPLYSSFTATLSLDNGETFNFTAPTNPNSTFFGFISPTPIMDLTFSDGGLFHPEPSVSLHEEMIGNLYMVLEVPAPAAITLAAFGAALLLGWRWRKIRNP